MLQATGLGFLVSQERKLINLVAILYRCFPTDPPLRDWPSNCQHLPASDILGPADVARRLARTLRVDHQCDFVIAITHMRLVEDLEVADATVHGEARVDLLLGGHDHEVVCRFAGDTNVDPGVIIQGRKNGDVTSDGQVRVETEGEVRIVKSGTDWRSYSVIHLTLDRVHDDKAVLKASRGIDPPCRRVGSY